MNNIKKHYDQKAGNYLISDVRLSKILEICANLKNKKVLDVGCSTGYLGQKLEKRGAEVTGIDISKVALKKAQEVLSFTKVVDLNEGELPFKDGTFDLIVASEVIEHLFKPVIVLKELRRILKDKGGIIITTPNFLYWGHRLQFLFGNFQYSKQGTFDESHVRFFSYSLLKQMLQKNQLNIIRENHLTGGLVGQLLVPLAPQVFASHLIVLSQRTS